jgi:hypothetical protein
MSLGHRSIWDAAYDEEFDGLNSIPTWKIPTKENFKMLSLVTWTIING